MKLHHGCCLDKLKKMSDNSVDSIVTDPPYGLKFMGKKWDYEVPSVDIWKEALRVLKPGGHLLSFGGTRTYHRMVVNVEDAGFQIRDQVGWCFGSGFPKSHNLKDEWKGWGSALKPAWEPIVVARKPLEKGLTLAQNVLKYGTGGLNIDGSRVAPQDKDDYGRSAANSKGTKNAHNGLEGKSFKIAEREADYASEQGRWPSNLIFDEAAAEMLDKQVGLLVGAGNKSVKTPKSKTEKSVFGAGGDGTPSTLYDRGGKASRFFYCAKASKRERGEGNTHPTIKPIKLMEYLIKLITPPSGTVLDPFMGSGSTGVAAKKLGFNFIGIELQKEYVEIAQKRIEAIT